MNRSGLSKNSGAILKALKKGSERWPAPLPLVYVLCLPDGFPAQDGAYLPECRCHGYKATAGWRFGNVIDGTQAEYVLVPDAEANLALIPDALTDEQVLMCPDVMSTGFKGAENANIKIGDTVAIFAQADRIMCHRRGAFARRQPDHCRQQFPRKAENGGRDGGKRPAELQGTRCG